jgi:GTP pyrophosphokinase
MTMLPARFADAMRYALQLHAAQLRKGTQVPYMAHLLGVASLALEHGADEDEAIAALLHDAVEDQGGLPTRAEIARRFGERVAAIVDGCTDADTTPKPPWRPRKEAYIAHLPHAGPSVRLVSAADKLHNARAIVRDVRAGGEAVWSRFNGGKDGTLWYYRALADAFNTLGPAALADELARTVAEMEALAAVTSP